MKYLEKKEIEGITVSSIDMAKYFAKSGWDDITIAFPVNIRQINELRSLAKNITLNLLVESPKVVAFLENHLSDAVNVWIKIDVGYHRTGIEVTKKDDILELAVQIQQSPNLMFQGLLTHAGHSYTSDKEKKRQILESSKQQLTTIRQYLQENKIDKVLLSYVIPPPVAYSMISPHLTSYDQEILHTMT